MIDGRGALGLSREAMVLCVQTGIESVMSVGCRLTTAKSVGDEQ